MNRIDPPPVPDPEGADNGAPGFWRELGRRHVFRTAALYVGGSAALLQGADIFQQALSLPEGTVRFLAVVAVCGLPVALVLSWAYDINTDGADPGGWGRHGLVLTVGLMAVAAAGVWLAGGWGSPEPSVAADPMPLNRVAILALDAPGATPEGAAFATYLQERLIEGLSAAGAASNVADSSRLRVISRAGTLPFSGGTFTTDSIGRALRAGTLVSGLVERVGTMVRVRLQLIDAASAEVLATSQVQAESEEGVRLLDAVADSLGRMVRQSLGKIIADRSVRLGTESETAFREVLDS